MEQDQEKVAETPEAETVEAEDHSDETLIEQAEREHPEEMAAARAERDARAATAPPRTPRKRKAPKDEPDPEFCDNHPDKPAVLSTTRGDSISRQRFCKKCAKRLPDGYDG